MLGTALVGSLVNHFSSRSVRHTLENSKAASGSHFLQDPQLLISQPEQQRFLSLMHNAGLDGPYWRV